MSYSSLFQIVTVSSELPVLFLAAPPPPPRRQPPVAEPSEAAKVMPPPGDSEISIPAEIPAPDVEQAALHEQPACEPADIVPPAENDPEFPPPPEDAADETTAEEPGYDVQKPESTSGEEHNDDNTSTCVNVNSDSMDTFSTTSDLQQKDTVASEDGQLDNEKVASAAAAAQEDITTNNKIAMSEKIQMKNVDEQIVEVEVHKELDG